MEVLLLQNKNILKDECLPFMDSELLLSYFCDRLYDKYPRSILSKRQKVIVTNKFFNEYNDCLNQVKTKFLYGYSND